MFTVDSVVRRRELGDFVRAQREQLAPAAIGLTGVRRRRTPGLRREEVAELAGLSTTWYTWIEQARDVSVSPTALARLAVALRLGRAFSNRPRAR
jgi:transcriptional regulator with XRE-family HTH domain